MTQQIGDVLQIDGKSLYTSDAISLPCSFSEQLGFQVDHEKIAIRTTGEFDRLYSYSLILNPEEHAQGAEAIYNEPPKNLFSDCITSSACLRRYIGVWEVLDGKLYLKALEGSYELFGMPLFAEWFTGDIEIMEGDVIERGLFKPRICETHIVIKFNRGNLISHEVSNHSLPENQKTTFDLSSNIPTFIRDPRKTTHVSNSMQMKRMLPRATRLWIEAILRRLQLARLMS